MNRRVLARYWGLMLLAVATMIVGSLARAEDQVPTKWGGFARALAIAGRTTDTMVRVQRQAALCEKALAMADAPAEVKETAQLKLASLLISGNHGTPKVAGLSNPKKGLGLADEVAAASKSAGDQVLARGLRARALAQLGQSREAERTLSEMEKTATEKRAIWAWAMALHDVLLAEGSTEDKVAQEFLKRSAKAGKSDLGAGCAIYAATACAKADSKSGEAVLEKAVELLGKYHPAGEDTRYATSAWEQVLKRREGQAAAAASSMADQFLGGLAAAGPSGQGCGGGAGGCGGGCGSPQAASASASQGCGGGAGGCGAGCGSGAQAASAASSGGCGGGCGSPQVASASASQGCGGGAGGCGGGCGSAGGAAPSAAQGCGSGGGCGAGCGSAPAAAAAGKR